MAITSAICNSFKQEILEAEHNFTASTGNTFNLALYDSDANLSKSTTQQQEQDHQQLIRFAPLLLVEIKQFLAELSQFNFQQMTRRMLS